jgi:hypothetical protein
MDFSTLNTAMGEAISTLKKSANGDPRMEKKIALLENATELATTLVEIALSSKRKKRTFQPIDRRPKNKLERKRKLFEKIKKAQMLRMRHQLIASAPIPKFPPGTSGTAVVGCDGPELIMLTDGKIVKAPPSLHLLPSQEKVFPPLPNPLR